MTEREPVEATSGLTPMLTEAETARLLRMHRSTLCRLAREGKAPVTPVYVTGSGRRYPRPEVERLLAGGQ